MRVRVVILVGVLLVAGCTGAPSTADTGDIRTTDTDTALDPSTESPTASPTPSATPTPLPPMAQNPWKKAPVTVAIIGTASTREYRPLVSEALRFWEANASSHTPYQIEYELVNSSLQADIVVNFVDEVKHCGGDLNKSYVGCAPILEPHDVPERQSEVRIESGLSDNSTIKVLKHEFGHTLGLKHSDADTLEFMATSVTLATTPKTDLSDRDYLWQNNSLTVYVDASTAVDSRHEYITDKVRTVVWNYNDYNHEKLPSDFALRLTEDPEKADITVKIVDETPNGEFSDVDAWGVDPDMDGALEYRTNATIYIRDAHHDEIGFYVGYWMGWLIYADEIEDLPSGYQPD